MCSAQHHTGGCVGRASQQPYGTNCNKVAVLGNSHAWCDDTGAVSVNDKVLCCAPAAGSSSGHDCSWKYLSRNVFIIIHRHRESPIANRNTNRKLASLTFASASSQLSRDKGEETMVRAWYFDSVPGDQREPHKGEDVSLEELVKIGVLYWKVRPCMCGYVHACWLHS